jgi:hypothetical protein
MISLPTEQEARAMLPSKLRKTLVQYFQARTDQCRHLGFSTYNQDDAMNSARYLIRSGVLLVRQVLDAYDDIR